MVFLIIMLIIATAVPAAAHHELGAPAPVVFSWVQLVVTLVGAVGLEGAYRVLFRRK